MKLAKVFAYLVTVTAGWRALHSLAAFIASVVILTHPASAMKIQQIKSPGGIEAWLVEEHSVPLLAMNFAFEGGLAQDPPAKPGVGNFLTSILDEGAGDLEAEKFHELMEELAVKMAFTAGRDHFSGSFQTLSVNRDPAFDLLRLALTKPRFDPSAVERMRTQLLASLAFSQRDPDRVGEREWFKLAFGDHPYGLAAEGTKASIEAITRDDLEAFRSRVFARGGLKISVVGDIDAKTLGPLLDTVFGGLAEKSDLTPVAKPSPLVGPKLKITDMDVPQSVAYFGHGGFVRHDPDFIPAFILNYIMGGGGFSSRLMEEVREKRGLAYGISTYLYTFDQAGLLFGQVATKNDAIKTSLDVIRAELKRMADEGPTAEELTNAINYQTGSYALRFDTNGKIANQLLGIQLEDLGIDYIEKRNALFSAVTISDVKRVAQRLFKADELIVTVVGRPMGLSQDDVGATAGAKGSSSGTAKPDQAPPAVLGKS